jgi:hypothetical protein
MDRLRVGWLEAFLRQRGAAVSGADAVAKCDAILLQVAGIGGFLESVLPLRPENDPIGNVGAEFPLENRGGLLAAPGMPPQDGCNVGLGMDDLRRLADGIGKCGSRECTDCNLRLTTGLAEMRQQFRNERCDCVIG